MILAAGRGERMRPLTDQVPKPLIQIGGRSLVHRHLEGLRAAGVRDFVINLGWLGEQLREALGDGAALGLRISYSEEGWPALESGGGLHHALPLLGDQPFLVVNGDIHADYPWPRLLHRAAEMPAEILAHLVMVPNPPHNPRGDFALDEDGKVRNDSKARLTFSGISIHRPEIFAGCQPGHFPMLPLWRAAADRGALSGEAFAGGWSDVGTPDRLDALRAGLASPSPRPLGSLT